MLRSNSPLRSSNHSVNRSPRLSPRSSPSTIISNRSSPMPYATIDNNERAPPPNKIDQQSSTTEELSPQQMQQHQYQIMNGGEHQHQHHPSSMLPPHSHTLNNNNNSNTKIKKNTPEARIKRGECPKCGIKTHSINWRKKKVPLNIEGKVYKGICMACNFISSDQQHVPYNPASNRMEDIYPHGMIGAQQQLMPPQQIGGSNEKMPPAPPIPEVEVSDDCTHQVSVITNDPDIISFEGGLVTLTSSDKSSVVYRMGSASQTGSGGGGEDKKSVESNHEKEDSVGYYPTKGMSHAAAKRLYQQQSLSSVYGMQQRQSQAVPELGNKGDLSISASVGTDYQQKKALDSNNSSGKPLSIAEAMQRGIHMAEDAEESLAPPPLATPKAPMTNVTTPIPYYTTPPQQHMEYYIQQQHQAELLRRQQLDQMYQYHAAAAAAGMLPPPNGGNFYAAGGTVEGLDNDLDSLEYSQSSYGSGNRSRHDQIHMPAPPPNIPYGNPPQFYYPNPMMIPPTNTNTNRRVGGHKIKQSSGMMNTPNTIMEEEFFMPSSSPPPSPPNNISENDHSEEEDSNNDLPNAFRKTTNPRGRTYTHPASILRSRIDSSEEIHNQTPEMHVNNSFRERFANNRNDSIMITKKRRQKQPNNISNSPKDNRNAVRFQENMFKDNGKQTKPAIPFNDDSIFDNVSAASSYSEGKKVIQQLQQQDLQMETSANQQANWSNSYGARDSKSHGNEVVVPLKQDGSFDDHPSPSTPNHASQEEYDVLNHHSQNAHTNAQYYDPFENSVGGEENPTTHTQSSTSNSLQFSLEPQHFFPEEAVEEFKEEISNMPQSFLSPEEIPSSLQHRPQDNYVKEEYNDMKQLLLPVLESKQQEESYEALIQLFSRYKSDAKKMSTFFNVLRDEITILNPSTHSIAHLFSITIHTIVECMWEHCASSSIQVSSCFMLWTLSSLYVSHSHLKPIIGNSGAIEAILVCAMEMHRSDGTVQLYACGALTSLAYQDGLSTSEEDIENENNTNTVVSVGAMISVVSVMETHPNLPLVQEFAIRAVYAMCYRLQSSSSSNSKSTYTNLMDFMQKGGIGLIKKAMEYHIDHLSLLEWSCRLLSVLCNNETIGKIMLSTGLVLTVWGIMKHLPLIESNSKGSSHHLPQEQQSLFIVSCQTILQLFSLDTALELASKTWEDILDYLLNILSSAKNEQNSNNKEDYTDVLIIEYSLLVLSHMIPQMILHKEFISSMPISFLIDTLYRVIIQGYPNNETMQEYAFKILQSLITNSVERKNAILDSDHIPILVHCLQEQFLSIRALEPICGVIASLCVEHERHASLLSNNILHSLVRVMEAHLKTCQIQYLSALALQNLSACSCHTEKMIEAGVVNALIQAMGHHLQCKELQEAACSALCFLSSMENCQDNHDQNVAIIVQAGGAKAVIHSMQEHSDYIPIQSIGCGVLWNLSFSAIASSSLSSSALNATTKDVSTADQNISSDVHSTCSIHDEDHKNVIAYNGGIDSIMFAILNNPNEMQLLENAIGALSSLVISRDTARLFITSGWIDMLLQVMKNCAVPTKSPANNKTYALSTASILQNSFLALRNLVLSSTTIHSSPNGSGNSNTFLSPGLTSTVVETIISAMNSYPDIGSLQREACGALFALSVLTEDNKALVVSSGGVDAMMNALDRNDCSLDVKETKMALVHLMTW